MGALHEGHLSLVRRSRSENDRTLVSIFVNRTQFDERTDYPKFVRPTRPVTVLEKERSPA